MQIYAVITGDFVGSSKFDTITRDHLFGSLKEIFKLLETTPIYGVDKPFEISRGDYFQGIILPEFALEASLLILTQIRKYNPDHFRTGKRSNRFTPVADLRLSIGVGSISYSKDKISESDGMAFWNSGRPLDKMKKKAPRIIMNTSNETINSELNVYAWLLDAIIDKWTIKSAEVINYILSGKKQFEIAQILNIRQPSVNGRLDAAHWAAVDKLLHRFNQLMKYFPYDSNH